MTSETPRTDAASSLEGYVSIDFARQLERELAAAQAEVQRLTGQYESCKQEAQIHAQEARTANSTISEIYQLCTGSTGEPGNWNGAEPVRKLVAELTRLNALIAWRDKHAPDLPVCRMKLEAAMKDAERYRFIRDQKESLFYLFPEEEIGNFGAAVDLATFPQFDELDEKVDAAIAQGRES